ncbi:hypothetical protein IWZ00DRAFT_89641 [Phyllosticta capitalensis]
MAKTASRPFRRLARTTLRFCGLSIRLCWLRFSAPGFPVSEPPPIINTIALPNRTRCCRSHHQNSNTPPLSGSIYTLQNIQATTRDVSGAKLGTRPASFLDPFYIFKGKVHAAAMRDKFHDAADVRWLESHFRDHIKARKDKLDLRSVGLAVKRYPELSLVFGRLGVDVSRAQAAANGVDLDKLPTVPPPGDVHRGLLG